MIIDHHKEIFQGLQMPKVPRFFLIHQGHFQILHLSLLAGQLQILLLLRLYCHVWVQLTVVAVGKKIDFTNFIIFNIFFNSGLLWAIFLLTWRWKKRYLSSSNSSGYIWWTINVASWTFPAWIASRILIRLSIPLNSTLLFISASSLNFSAASLKPSKRN